VDRLKFAFVALLVASPAAAQQCGTLTTCPPVSTPLAGTELLYTVQGGVSKKMTVTQLGLALGPYFALTPGVSPIVPTTNGGLLWDNNGKLADSLAPLQTALPSLAANQIYGGTGAAGAAQAFSLGAGVPAWLITPTSANLAAAVTDETGTGPLVFASSPALTGTPTATTQTTSDTSTAIATDGFVNAKLILALPNLTTGQLYGGAGVAGVSQHFPAGTGVEPALQVNVGTVGSPVINGGALGTPSSGVGTNITGVNAAQLGGATFSAPGTIGGGTPAPATFTTIGGTTSTLSASLKFANLADSATAPTISSGCGGGSPSISAPNGTDAFVVTIGTASGSTCVVAMPTATTGWICSANDITTHTTANFQVLQTASSASSVTVTDYSDIAGAATWVSADKIGFLCRAY